MVLLGLGPAVLESGEELFFGFGGDVGADVSDCAGESVSEAACLYCDVEDLAGSLLLRSTVGLGQSGECGFVAEGWRNVQRARGY